MMDLHQTKDYDKFKMIDCNRKINKAHVAFLQASIKVKNMLERNPIKVNENYEILDGQHRHQACKNLGETLWYIIDKEAETDDIVRLNSTSLNWAPADYIHYYKTLGKQAYKVLEEFCNKNNTTVYIAARLLKIRKQNSIKYVIESGIIPPISEERVEEAQKLMDQCNEIISFIDSRSVGRLLFLRQRNFMRGLIALLLTEDFHLNTFLSKLESNVSKLIKCVDSKAYYQRFLDIYNWRNQKPIG